MNLPPKIYRGRFLQALNDHKALYISDGLALVGAEGESKGKLLALGPAEAIAAEYSLDLNAIPFESGLYLPAFYDLHFHWVQDSVREMPKTSLLEWLAQYTFPTEAKFADPEFAEQAASVFWKRILSVGTIGGLCYSSIHETALEAALRHAPENFRIGNVLMTMNCPDYLQQTEAEAIASVERCAERFADRYVASPRFAPTTGPEVMAASAAAAKRFDCFQQTHLGETIPEIEWVLGMYHEMSGFEAVPSYTAVYDQVGMLGPKTVFGHCIHLSPEEWTLLAESDSIIASCPSSNAPLEMLGLGSGLFDFQMADRYGVRWSLCSDIGGGPFLSMFDVMESFVLQNKAAGTPASYIQALYRSSTKGAELLGLGETKGQLQPGYDFDVIRVPLAAEMADCEDPESLLESVVHSVQSREAYDALVEATIVRGEAVFVKSEGVNS